MSSTEILPEFIESFVSESSERVVGNVKQMFEILKVIHQWYLFFILDYVQLWAKAENKCEKFQCCKSKINHGVSSFIGIADSLETASCLIPSIDTCLAHAADYSILAISCIRFHTTIVGFMFSCLLSLGLAAGPVYRRRLEPLLLWWQLWGRVSLLSAK